MRISDWSSDVCSSDLAMAPGEFRVSGDEVVMERLLRGDLAGQVLLQPLGQQGGQLHGAVFREQQTLCLKIGRASCRERMCTYVSFSVVGASLKQSSSSYTIT